MASPEKHTSSASQAEPRNIQQITATHVADVNVKSPDNTSTCIIMGIATLPHDKLVVADFENETLKLIDTENNAVISELIPEDFPYGVTVNNDTIATTLPNASKIVFVKYERGLVKDRDISVDGRCKGIDWNDDKLYVAFCDKKKVEVMTTDGVVLQRFTATETGEQLFDFPRFVAVCAAKKRIYVSDQDGEKVIVLDMDGKQTGVYDDDELDEPSQLAVDNTRGVMYLGDYGNNTVHLLSPDCEKVKILLTSEEGVASPDCTCYCEKTRRLYVGIDDCDTVKVYQIS